MPGDVSLPTTAASRTTPRLAVGYSRVASPRTPPPDEFRSLLHKLWRRRQFVVIGVVCVVGAVAVLTYLQPRTYRSSALVLVEEQNRRTDIPVLAALQSLTGDQIETEIELIKSRNVLESVVDQLDLHVSVEASDDRLRPGEVLRDFTAGPDAVPGSYVVRSDRASGYVVTDLETEAVVAVGNPELEITFAGLAGTIPPALVAQGFTIHTSRFGVAVQNAQRQVDVSRVNGEADVIRVVCEGPAPELAHALCDRTLRNYIQLRTNLQRAEATAEATFLRGQVTRLGEQLEAAEDSLESFSRRNQVVALADRATEEVTKYTQLKGERDALEAERSALAGLIQEIESESVDTRKYRDLASFPTFLRNNSVRELLSDVNRLEDQRAELVLRRSEENQDVVAVDGRIADLERQVRSIAVSYEHSLAAQIRSIDTTLVQMSRSLATLPTTQVQVERLERQAESLEDLYRLLETRLREAEVAEAVNLPSVRVVDAASMPLAPASPNPQLNLALGLVLGLGVGVLLALYRDSADTSLRERQEVERETGLPVLSMIPRQRDAGPLIPFKRLRPHQNNSRKVLTASGAYEPEKPVRARREQSEAMTEFTIEAIRSLAADLSFAGTAHGLDSAQAVAITSAGRDEGKTFTACNLAMIRATHGTKTLLIDADLRAAGATRFFNVPPDRDGLSDLLQGKCELSEVSLEIAVDQSKLWMIPAGTPTANATPLLESPEFGKLINRARTKFDLIIVDTAPLSLISDAATIATVVNSVVVVVRGGRTDRDALEITLDRLARCGGNVIGVVLNDVRVPGGYYSRYAYGYGTYGTKKA